jgi:hypothetical protein
MNKKLIGKVLTAGNKKSVDSDTHRWPGKFWTGPMLLLAALAISKPSPAFAVEANLIVNGDFEEPPLPCRLWLPVPEGSGFITGWNINVPSTNNDNAGCDSFPNYSHSVDLLFFAGGPYPIVYTGQQSVDMSGTYSTPGDSIYQDVPTKPGQTYTLTFYTSSNGGPMEDGLTVEWDNVPIATLSTPDQGDWSVHTYTVQANSELTRLRFIGNVGGGQGTLLDTVSLVGGSDQEAPVVSCPPATTVPFGSVPPAATSVAEFTAQGGSITDNQDPNPSVGSSDQVSGSCPTLVARTYTVTDASGNATQCQQLITVQNLFATNGIVWFPPLARFNGDTDPSVNVTLKYVFKLGSTIPVKIRALGCDGTDLTSNGNIIGTLEVFPVSGCDGVADANASPIDINGLGGAGGLMEKVDGYLRYNLDTKGLPGDIHCYLLKATIVDTATGEFLSEFLPIQGR